MQISPYGQDGLLVQFEEQIDPLVNAQVHALNRALQEAHLPGVRFSTPAYCSLLVNFDAAKMSFATLSAYLREWSKAARNQEEYTARQWRIPVCFASSFAWDQEAVLAHTGLPNWSAVVESFTAQRLRVYMLGFLPGFPYLGELSEALRCPRKANPRAEVPAQSVSIAGQQAGIYPSASPGGWQIIGRTPVPLFNPHDDKPFLFSAGDEVMFYSITEELFAEIAIQFAIRQRDWLTL